MGSLKKTMDVGSFDIGKNTLIAPAARAEARYRQNWEKTDASLNDAGFPAYDRAGQSST
jgi:hypothetical protein